MSASRTSLGFLYLETEIPPGLTICEWRAQRAAARRKPRRGLGRLWWRAGAVGGARSCPRAKHGAAAGSQALRCASPGES
jgi:hypothetical protein